MFSPRGAVYIPARAFNAFQLWRDYDREVIGRDLGYAKLLNLNAIRIWLSFEYWSAHADEHKAKLDHLLTTAREAGIKVMPSLFECCGIEPTDAAKNNTDPLTACCIRSPGTAIMKDPSQWGHCVEYVHWFMQAFGDDDRLAAIEIINEPEPVYEFKFASEMFKSAAGERRKIGLTFGARTFEDSRLMQDLGLDVLQMHENFQPNEKSLRQRLDRAAQTQELLARPVWLTEWQRLRPGGPGWGDQPVHGDEWQPAYATMAKIVHSYPIGNFFWSLMLKPAYLLEQRKKGTLNGVFHEDGAVWSLADARAIAQDPKLQFTERRQWPEFCRKIAETLGKQPVEKK